MSYDCTHAAVTFAHRHGRRDGCLDAGGQHVRTPVRADGRGSAPAAVVAAPGRTAVITARTTCGSHLTYTVRSGVQRARGGYNYGQLATVVTP